MGTGSAEGPQQNNRPLASSVTGWVTIGRGYDPCSFVLFAFGGAGPLHVCAYALGTGVRHAIVPSLASVLSAFDARPALALAPARG